MVTNITENAKKGITRSITSFKNITLEGVTRLKIDKVKEIFRMVYKIHPLTNEPFCSGEKELVSQEIQTLCFELKEITAKELAIYRENGTPSFVLKKDGKLYYTEIPKKISFINADILGNHLCGMGCARLSAASDEHGGCAKVRNDAKYIESFPWITEGYETFNTRVDTFMVAKCSHHVPTKARASMTVEQRKRARLTLAQYLFDDLEEPQQIRVLKRRGF